MPSTGATTSCGIPSMSTAPSRSPARTRAPATAVEPGWKMPTAGEVAIGRERSHSGTGIASRRTVGVAPAQPARGLAPFRSWLQWLRWP